MRVQNVPTLVAQRRVGSDLGLEGLEESFREDSPVGSGVSGRGSMVTTEQGSGVEGFWDSRLVRRTKIEAHAFVLRPLKAQAASCKGT